jgi:hypothetical protein
MATVEAFLTLLIEQQPAMLLTTICLVSHSSGLADWSFLSKLRNGEGTMP